MQFFKYSFILIFFLAFSGAIIAENAYPISGDKPTIFQIEDKYNEVKLCLTKSSIYMQIKSSVKDYINQEIVQRHSIEASQFIDSQGHFLLGDMVLLSSEKIEYSFDDIEDITFEDGVISFTYNKDKSFTFSDILSTDGNPALQNFYVEDLEKFYMNYKKITS